MQEMMKSAGSSDDPHLSTDANRSTAVGGRVSDWPVAGSNPKREPVWRNKGLAEA